MHRWHPQISGDGPALLLQGPAWGPTSDYLRLTLAPLLEGFRVITCDPRNVGSGPRVDAPDAQAVGNLVDDLESLRVQLELERFLLAGHSHGGFIAMAYAVRHAGRLDGLLLLNTKVRHAPSDPDTDRLLRRWEEDPRRRDAVQALRATGGRPPVATSDAELARGMRLLMPAYFHDLEAMQSFARDARVARPPSAYALARVPDRLEGWVEEGLAAVDVPTLVITGRHDVVTTPADARHIGALLPRARVEILPRSGHHPWAEEPQRFAALVRGFLAELT